MLALHQAKDGTSAVTEAITAAVRDSGGKALGGRAVIIPLLERCRTETTVQVAIAIAYIMDYSSLVESENCCTQRSDENAVCVLCDVCAKHHNVHVTCEWKVLPMPC